MFRGFKKDKAFRKPKRPEMFVPPKNELGDLTDDELDKLTRQLEKIGGDKQLAQKIMKLKAQYPVATIPELLTYEWLSRKNIQFEFQAVFAGGRARRGGLVPDFLLRRGASGAMVWHIDGERWHDPLFHGRGYRDISADIRMMGKTISGLRVEKIIHITDTAIYRSYPQVYDYALAGMQLNP